MKMRRKGIQASRYSQRYIPFPLDLARAMACLYSQKGIEAKADDLLDTALAILQFFGFESEVVANHLGARGSRRDVPAGRPWFG